MRRFWSDAKGNVAILFGLATIPVIGAMGAAVDYSLANLSRTDMQKALDSTALALTKMMPTSQANLDEKGMQFFKASLGTQPIANLELVVTPGNGTLHLEAKGLYTPKLAGIMGVNTFPIGARTQTKWGIGKVEVVLALDNTGSMASSGKLTQLKLAAHNLLDTLKDAAKNPGDAKVGIVPFGVQVKVPTSNVNASWIRWDLWDEENGSCNKSGGYNTKSSCENQKVCTKSQYSSKNSCENNNGNWVNATWTPSNHNTWNGCIADRDKDTNVNYDANDTAPNLTNSMTAANVATRFPAAQECGSLAEVMPLNYNWGTTGSTDATTLHGKINQMQAVGNTNVTIGLAWAWHLLSPTDIYTEGTAYGTANTQKFIILLTDGDNTQNRFSSSESSINARTTAACNNIKALKNANGDPYIKVYTIRVIDGNATLLKGCATKEEMYYNVTSASDLNGVFATIGSEIANLHLAK
jgi:Flp pilus assembly protein TadG